MSRLLKNRRGQSTIEALALAMALLTVISSLAALFYFGLVHAGMNYLLHEFLVCESTQGSTDCKTEFHNRATPFLFAGKIQYFESSSRFGKYQARLTLQMPLKRRLTIKKELKVY